MLLLGDSIPDQSFQSAILNCGTQRGRMKDEDSGQLIPGPRVSGRDFPLHHTARPSPPPSLADPKGEGLVTGARTSVCPGHCWLSQVYLEKASALASAPTGKAHLPWAWHLLPGGGLEVHFYWPALTRFFKWETVIPSAVDQGRVCVVQWGQPAAVQRGSCRGH